MVNRRAFRRTKVQREVVITPLDKARRRRWLFNPIRTTVPASGKIVDIGIGGMCAEFPTELAVGTACEVRITGENGEVQTARGVVRSYRADNGTRAVGIAFQEPLLTLGDPATDAESVGYEGAEPSALVVDDDPGVLYVLEKFLRSRGLRVKTATNGAEALAILRREEPALLMIDLKMPQISGVQLLEQMKAEGLRASHVWAMSGCVNDDEALSALSMGAAEFFDKPFDLEHLDSNLQGLSPML